MGSDVERMSFGCLCRDSTHPNPSCLQHGGKKVKPKGNPVLRSKPMQSSEKPVKKVSEKGKLREAFLRGVKAAKIVQRPICNRCGLKLDDERRAWSSLDLHHVKPRRSGKGWSGGSSWVVSVDHPDNLVLLCKPCHKKEQT